MDRFMSVIVTNAKNRIAYNVVRSLGEKGVAIYAADFVPRSMCFASRYVRGHFIYPSPFRDPDGFIDCLLTEIERVKAKVLIPVFEETFLISKHMDRLSPHVALALPTYEQILAAHNKDAWEHVARRLGVPVPSNYSVEELRAGTLSTRDLSYPVLIKPKQGGGAWGIKEATTAAMLDEYLQGPDWDGKPWDRFFVQQKILGETHCVAMLFSHGHLRAKVAYRQLRDYPITGGQATLRVSLRSEKAEDCFQRMLEGLDWHGACQADFIVDHRTGTPYLIDINPRLWGSLVEAIACGVDFPYLLYRMATEGDVQPVPSFKTGVVTRWLGGELAALPGRLRRSNAKLQLLGDFVFPEVRSSLYDDFSLSDPLPFMAWGLDTALKAVRSRSVNAVSHDSLDGIWK
jgi:predicted ATP-grasp superfamily ATP-dependent carboligase